MAYIPKDARWYLADLVMECIVKGDPRNVVHVNRHLIEARSPEQAYRKALLLGRKSEQRFTNTDGRNVRFVFRGLRNLDVIHEALEDGAELAYEELTDLPAAELAKCLRSKNQLAVFSRRRVKRNIPNYMPRSVMRSLREAGFGQRKVKRRTKSNVVRH
jgi:hypothetical protein